jgi:hypothetical protein
MNKNNNTSNAFDMGSVLVIGAAAFAAYHMGRAFHVYDPDGWHFMNVNIGGLILGAILNFIIARAAIHLPTISANFLSLKELLPKVSKKADKKVDQARSRAMKKMIMAMKQNAYSQAGFYILISFSALMVAPALYILWSETLPFHWIFVAVMAFAGAIAPDIAITVGGFISGKTDAAESAKSASQSVARPRKSEPSPTESAKSASQSDGLSRTYPRRCEHCASDSPFGVLKSPNAIGGHMKKHHPELCKPKVAATLADNLFTKVSK